MALGKKKKEVEVDEVVVSEVVEVQHVVENLKVDVNDPRVVNPTVDGNDQPKVDINVPAQNYSQLSTYCNDGCFFVKINSGTTIYGKKQQNILIRRTKSRTRGQ